MRGSSVLLLILFAAKAHALSCGSLAAVQGSVDVLRNQQKSGEEATRFVVPGKNFLALECDDIIVTRENSAARIIMANGKISVGPDSRIEIAGIVGEQKPAVSIVNLAYGKVRALIQKRKDEPAPTPAAAQGPQSSFRIRTHTAVAGVRGTDFFVGFDPNAGVTEQATLSGKVEVEHQETGQKVLVSEGQQVVAQSKDSLAADGSALHEVAKVPVLKPAPIQESLKNELRVASAISKDDKDFVTENAVKTLGRPETWTIEREAIPKKYKDIKNEF